MRERICRRRFLAALPALAAGTTAYFDIGAAWRKRESGLYEAAALALDEIPIDELRFFKAGEYQLEGVFEIDPATMRATGRLRTFVVSVVREA